MKLPYKLLIYDIETTPLLAYIWRLGEQVVRHDQLFHTHSNYRITTLAYKWYGEKEVHVLTGTVKEIIEKFDEKVKEADVVLGKNSDRFDVKHVNTQRLLAGLPPMPYWMSISDDLEKQIRKYFMFPSFSLDYISKLFGTGGKSKMEFSDWVHIEEAHILSLVSDRLKFLKLKIVIQPILNAVSLALFGKAASKVLDEGEIALDKMASYNKKDVLDTEAALKKVLPHIQLKHNAARNIAATADKEDDSPKCTACGSASIVRGKKVVIGNTRYQLFHCLDHNGYAGKATYYWNSKRNCVCGRIQK